MDPLQIKILSVDIAYFKSNSIVFVFEKYILKGQLHNNQLKNRAKNEREQCAYLLQSKCFLKFNSSFEKQI